MSKNCHYVIKTLLKEIRDEESCFDADYVFEFDGWLYEKCNFDHHMFRVIFCCDDYDYVEGEELIQKLNIAYLVQA